MNSIWKFERHLEDVLYWVVQWNDTPLDELREGPPGYLERGLRTFGEQFARNNTRITVTVTKEENPNYKPWGTTTKPRKIRDLRIVALRKAGLTFTDIGKRVGMSRTGVRGAYEREIKKQEEQC